MTLAFFQPQPSGTQPVLQDLSEMTESSPALLLYDDTNNLKYHTAYMKMIQEWPVRTGLMLNF